MKKVISFSMFAGQRDGHADDRWLYYRKFVPAVLRSYMAAFPDYLIVIHHDESLFVGYYGPVLVRLARLHPDRVRLVYVGESQAACLSMIWRLKPIWDCDADYVFCRDLDAVATVRERRCCEDFIETGFDIHSISDSVSHDVAIMGGMCGFRSQAIRQNRPSWQSLIDADPAFDWHASGGVDQIYMSRYLWHKMPVETHVGHRLYHDNPAFGEGRKFWTPQAERPADVGAHLDQMDSLTRHIGGVTFDGQAIEWLDEYARVETAIVRDVESVTHQVSSLYSMHVNPRFAVMAVSLNETYSRFLPIVATLWREAIGYVPIVMLIGTPREWIGKPEVTFAREAGAEIYFVPRVPGVADATIAQVSRLFAHSVQYRGVGIPRHNQFITSDADLLPLSRAFFWQSPILDRRLRLFYGNCHADGKAYPIGYIEANGSTWREIMGGRGLNDMPEFIKRRLKDIEPNSLDAWCLDEHLIGELVNAWPGREGDTEIIERKGGPPVDRIDRADWKPWFPGAVDAHSVRPPDTDENWPKIREVISHVLTPERMTFLDAYIKEVKHGN